MALEKLYSGWGTGPNGGYIAFDCAEVRNLTKLGSPGHEFYHYEVAHDGAWVEVESMDPPDLEIARELAAQVHPTGFVDKVRAEVNELFEDGLLEVDIKQAVLKKYGRDVYDLVFAGE
jgi:hypothetical protein